MNPSDAIPTVNFYINFWEVLTVILTTLILFLLIKKYFWETLESYLTARQQYIEDSVEKAKQAEIAAKNADQMASERISSAQKEALEIVNESKHKANKVYDDIISDAKKDAQSRIDNATREINYQKEKMKQEVREEMVDIALLASEQLLKEKVDKQDDKKLVEKLVEELN